MTATEWGMLTIPDFDRIVIDSPPEVAVSLGVLDRLPFTFDSKDQFLQWRDHLAKGFDLDGRDIALVGSAASGRSLSSRKRFGVFGSKSDMDIAVISHYHFELSWRWFRRTDPNFLTGLDSTGRERFDAHRSHYIFEGVVAADYFLSYFSFGDPWSDALRRSQDLLPAVLKGRLMKVRIYRDYGALRLAQTDAVRIYRKYLSANEAESGSDA